VKILIKNESVNVNHAVTFLTVSQILCSWCMFGYQQYGRR